MKKKREKTQDLVSFIHKWGSFQPFLCIAFDAVGSDFGKKFEQTKGKGGHNE